MSSSHRPGRGDGAFDATRGGRRRGGGSLLAVLDSEGLRSDLAAARLQLEISLIEVDQARLKELQEVAKAKDDLAAAKEALAQAEAEIPVMEELFALGGISRFELDEAKASARSARSNLVRAEERLAAAERQAELAVKKAEQEAASARAKVAELEKLVADLEVVAPVDARVLESQVSPGERLEQGSVLFRLADVRSQYVETSVTPEQARELRAGAPALIRTSDAQYPARVAGLPWPRPRIQARKCPCGSQSLPRSPPSSCPTPQSRSRSSSVR